jgi:hypothetical protein
MKYFLRCQNQKQSELRINLYLIVSLTFFLFVGCDTTKKAISKETYLPEIINNIKLGMTMEQTLKLRNKSYVVNSLQATPRHIYTEDLDTDNFIAVYYFFSKKELKKLVEINILHSNKKAAEKTVNQYFGKTENKQNQWYKKLKNNTLIYATWHNQKVFIYMETDKKSNHQVE